ncbi:MULTISPECIES: AI-2E family transporter [unclassified Modicisalibacter]|uniref:AI-2E family transporter n=1 Tax=unclassified Modicisalibacter TaxID=2679913 RepID=UPI001CCA0A5A|nr:MULTISPECIES: AI-2E family transporter [unclassified Modicisalibacter]MBZ9557879.1 AI-2E family transporter [Modicisalibacter sp. R2A 31.J]MBZ9573454.1 AI-2E family transporter [Modicisalibacter sp. MOD 31.J]
MTMNKFPTSKTPDTEKRPWMEAMPRWVGIGIFLYLSIFALGFAQLFLVPVVLAFLLSMVFSPIRRFFDRRGVSQGWSAVIIMSTLLAGLLMIATALAVPVSGWINNAPAIERKIEIRFNEVSGPFSGFFSAKEKLESMTQSDNNQVQQVETQDDSLTKKLASLIPTFITQSLFTLVLLLFLLASGDMFYEKIVHVMPTLRDKKRAVRITQDIERKLSRYLFTITLINAGLGIAVGTAMWALGMPSPLSFGLIAFLFNFIPYLGALAGILIASVVAIVSFDWLGWPLIVAGTYFLLTTLEGQLITPYFVGRSLRLNTVVVFLTISFWAWLWSVVGMIVAVPLLVAVKTLSEHIEALEPLGHFLAERHAELIRNDADDGSAAP